MTRARLLAETDSEELTLWEVFGSLDPGGELRGDLQAGTVAAACMNAWGGGKDGKAISPLELVPDFWGERKSRESDGPVTLAGEGEGEAEAARWRAAVEALGGEVVERTSGRHRPADAEGGG